MVGAPEWKETKAGSDRGSKGSPTNGPTPSDVRQGLRVASRRGVTGVGQKLPASYLLILCLQTCIFLRKRATAPPSLPEISCSSSGGPNPSAVDLCPLQEVPGAGTSLLTVSHSSPLP